MRQRHWQYLIVAVVLATCAGRSAPPVRSQASVSGQEPTGNEIPYQATAGGSASLTGFQVPALVLSARGEGIGRVSISGPNPSLLNTTVQVTADIDVSQNPVQIRNGTLTLVAPNGDEVQGVFEGTGSAPDAAGFIDVTTTFRITGGKGRYSGGGGTVTGVVNFVRSSFSIAVNGNVVRAASP
jgi:uncharacterized protein (DUF2345 family)